MVKIYLKGVFSVAMNRRGWLITNITIIVLMYLSIIRPDGFLYRKVIIIGLGGTVVDIVTSLVGYADEIYISYRRGVFLVNFFPHGFCSD